MLRQEPGFRDKDEDSAKIQPRFEELRGWIEFCSWTILAFAPILYWGNGPVVSRDQFVIRTALVSLATIGALSLRLYAWLKQH